MDKLEIKTSIGILKPAQDVFENIVNPQKMSKYFIAESTGPMETGKTVNWKWPEFDERFDVQVKDVRPNQFISFTWPAESGESMLVEITLEELPGNATKVILTEKEQPNNEAGIKWLKGNTEGWANFLACLKAFSEYGINLRKGAFDFMSDD